MQASEWYICYVLLPCMVAWPAIHALPHQSRPNVLSGQGRFCRAHAGSASPRLARVLTRLDRNCEHGSSELCAALEHDAPLLRSLAGLLLAALNHRAAQVAAGPLPERYWGDTDAVVCALSTPLLQRAVSELFAGSGGGPTALESTAQLMLRAPPDMGSGGTLLQQASAHSSLDELLLTFVMQSLQAAGDAGSRASSISVASRVEHLLLPLLPKLWPLLQLGMRAAAFNPLPLACFCCCWAGILYGLAEAHHKAFSPGSPVPAAVEASHSAAVYTAATAALRLLPLLCEAGKLLDASCATFDARPCSNAVKQLARGCLLLAGAAHVQSSKLGKLLTPPLWLDVQAPIWQLHTTCCQLIHWILGETAAEQEQHAQLLPLLSEPECWMRLTGLTSSLMCATVDALREALGKIHGTAATSSKVTEQVAR